MDNEAVIICTVNEVAKKMRANMRHVNVGEDLNDLNKSNFVYMSNIAKTIIVTMDMAAIAFGIAPSSLGPVVS